jgi:GntR family transcriptional repressor for pyruvate dehydrogenase complex
VVDLLQNENSASLKVYNYVMEKIVSNVWKPRARIMSENQLAVELNVSRIAVREALEKLSAFGLLNKKQGYGTVVNEINSSILLNNLVPIIALNQNGIKDIIEFRIHFEVGNVEMFMKNYDEDAVNQLRSYYEEMCSNYNNPEQYNLYDFQFHKAIAMGTKNPIVISITDILHSILKHNITRLYENVGPAVAMYYHKVILEAIEKKDSELACLLMRRHLEAALQQVSE